MIWIRLLDLLLDSINNVRRELKFFEDVAQRYELDINAEEEDVSEGVKLYRELFFETGEAVEAGRVGMLEGLVLLWGTEKVCLLLSSIPSSLFLAVTIPRWRYLDLAEVTDGGSATSKPGGTRLPTPLLPN